MKEIYNFIQRSVTGETPAKDEARSFTVDYIMDNFLERGLTRPKLLTLPGMYWVFEKEMSNTIYSYLSDDKRPIMHPKYFGCERDWKAFMLASIQIPHGKYETIHQKHFKAMNCQAIVNNGSHI